MKNLLLAVSFFAFLSACMVGEKKNTKNQSALQVNDTQSVLKSAKGEVVGFYNVENLFDTIDDKHTIDEQFLPNSEKKWTAKRYEHKLNQLGKVISTIKLGTYPIFMGLAEVENKRVVKDLIATDKLKNAGYAIVHQDSPDKRGIDVAFIYRQDYFKVDTFESMEVSLTDNPDFFTRDILYVKGELKGEDKVHVFLNHWSSRRGGEAETEHKRVKAAEILRAKVDDILNNDENAKIIIMGDFNDYPVNKSIEEVLRAKSDKKFTNGNLYNTAYALEKDEKGTYNYRGDWGMLDQLIISKGFSKSKKGVTIKEKSCTIHKEDWMLYTDPKYKDQKPSKTYGGPEYYGGYSDHLPIYIKLN